MKTLLLFPLMFFKLITQSIRLAMAQIWANKTRSVLTTLGIIIGVASVTAVIAAMSGLKAKIMQDVQTFGTNKIFCWPDWPESGPMKHASWQVIRFQPEQFEGLLDHCPSVKQFTKITMTNDAVRYQDRSLESVRVYGIETPWHDIESRKPIEGGTFSLVDEMQGRMVCLVDPGLRDKLRMDRNCVGAFLNIGEFTYRVVGVVEKQPSFAMFGSGGQGEQYEVFIPFMTMYRSNSSERWFQVMAASRTPEVSEEAKAELTFFLRQKRNLKPGLPNTFKIETVASGVKTFNTIAQRFTMVAGGVVGISLLVGGIGIMNIMLVSVSERTREIGLRKAVGARNSDILTQFLVEAVVLCCIGGLLGVGLGQFMTSMIAKIPQANLDKAYIPLWAVLMSIGFSGMVGVFFGMFPAVKAANLDPIEALRHE
jgi:putative ABC transport system permease protein